MTKRLLALLAVLALALSACSDSDDGDSATDGTEGTTATTAAETSSTTAGATEGGSTGADTELSRIVDRLDQESARFEGTMHLVGTPGSQLADAVDIPVTGAFDPAHDASQISMDLSAMAQADGQQMPPGLDAVFEEPIEVIAVGDKSWIKFSLLGMVSGADTEWIEVSREQTGELTSNLGLGSDITSPTSLLEQLRRADGDVEELGTESVRGHETTHYRIEVDLAALSQQLPAEEQDQLQDGLGQMDQPLPVEFWVGGGDRLYRYRIEMADTTPDDGQESSASLQFEFFDHGSTIDIQPPPADKVTSIEGLEGVLGDVLGGGTDPSEGSTGGGETSTEGTGGG